jgi:hypothetical protein
MGESPDHMTDGSCLVVSEVNELDLPLVCVQPVGSALFELFVAELFAATRANAGGCS